MIMYEPRVYFYRAGSLSYDITLLYIKNAKAATFWPKFNIFFAKLNFNFLLHSFSRYVICGFFFQFFCTKGSGRYGSDKGSVTHRQTDGHTQREEQHMSPAGGDISFIYIIYIYISSSSNMCV